MNPNPNPNHLAGTALDWFTISDIATLGKLKEEGREVAAIHSACWEYKTDKEQGRDRNFARFVRNSLTGKEPVFRGVCGCAGTKWKKTIDPLVQILQTGRVGWHWTLDPDMAHHCSEGSDGLGMIISVKLEDLPGWEVYYGREYYADELEIAPIDDKIAKARVYATEEVRRLLTDLVPSPGMEIDWHNICELSQFIDVDIRGFQNILKARYNYHPGYKEEPLCRYYLLEGSPAIECAVCKGKFVPTLVQKHGKELDRKQWSNATTTEQAQISDGICSDACWKARMGRVSA